MKRIGLAGGIGSGKSLAAEKLISMGFGVIDSDEVARRIVQPGSKTLQTLVDAFGSAILTTGAELDRIYLAELVFNDKGALRRLNAITHPEIARMILDELDQSRSITMFVALPLIRNEHREIFNLDEIWVIETSPAVAADRLVRFRKFTESQAWARIMNQPANEERRKIADRLIENNGDADELSLKIERLCRETDIVR